MVPTVHPASLADEELIRLVAGSDRDAFLALYDRYAPRMLGLILTVVRDRSSADDVLQKVMLEVWQKHAARYQPVLGTVEGWMLRLAKSRAIDHARSSGKSRTVPAEELGEQYVERSMGGSLEPNERRALADAVRSLPSDERESVVMAYLHGLSREEIAAQCGVPVGTVKTRIRRAVGRLREQLTHAGVSG